MSWKIEASQPEYTNQRNAGSQRFPPGTVNRKQNKRKPEMSQQCQINDSVPAQVDRVHRYL